MPQQLSVTLLGPDIDHRKSLEAMLAGRVSSVAWHPDSASMMSGRPSSVRRRIETAFARLTYTRDAEFLAGLIEHLDRNRTDVVIAYWGTGPLPDLLAIKRARPQIKLVLMVLCFPLAFESYGISRQRWLMRRAAAVLDGILYSNSAMQSYFERHIFGRSAGQKGNRHAAGLILNPCWPESYQSYHATDTQNRKSPNLIFIGRTDLSHHTIHVADDLRSLMAEILDNEIELHHVRSEETSDGHPFRRAFEPQSQMDLIARIATHDASLIAYNEAACARADRLECTVPDRALTSVAAGTPIAIPRKGYQGTKEYLRNYPAVIEFDSIPDLKRQLLDRDSVQSLKEAAWAARKLYAAEAQGETLAGFLVSL